MTKIKLSHPKLGERVLVKQDSLVTISSGEGEELEQRLLKSELTAQAYLHFLLLFFADTGYKRVIT